MGYNDWEVVMAETRLNVRVNSTIKKQAEAVFTALGTA